MKADVIKWDLYSGRGTVKSKNAFIGFMELLHENGHELLSEYINDKTKVLINFGCEHEPHWISPGSYKSGIRCPKCSGRCPKQVREEFLALLRRNNHELLSNYINNATKVLINFNCGHDPHWISPGSYKKGVRCPKCYENYYKQAEEELIALLTKNNHKLLSNYVNSTTKVLINFNCGHDPHWISPGSYKKGVRCPKCKLPKGEKIILDYLTESGINAISQYRIDGHKFRFDIYIREYNLIVEVNGRQHYEEVDFFGGRTLEEERMNDYEKEKLAVSKGYNYMAIDYKEHKPELALERFKEKFCFYETKQPKFEVIL